MVGNGPGASALGFYKQEKWFAFHSNYSGKTQENLNQENDNIWSIFKKGNPNCWVDYKGGQEWRPDKKLLHLSLDHRGNSRDGQKRTDSGYI